MSRRAFVVVADACGAGELPDAGDYGDRGSNTLGHVAQAVGGLDLPVLGRLGLGCILPLEGVPPAAAPALHGRLAAQGYGKDSTSGHWELMGAVAPVPPPTYPHGFPDELVATLERMTGLRLICNRPYDGLAVLDGYGAEAQRDGSVILYTSQDSVLQLAAHGASSRGPSAASPAPSSAPRGAETSRLRPRAGPTSTSYALRACPSTPSARSATCSRARGSTRCIPAQRTRAPCARRRGSSTSSTAASCSRT